MLTNCQSKKHFTLLNLPRRVMNLPMPQMRLIDLRQGEITQKSMNLISEPLARHLKETLAKKEQVILLLNRRGYSNFVFCPSCKHTLNCRNCDVTLTFHKSKAPRYKRMRTVTGEHMNYGYAICHYCLARTLVPEKCPLCGKGFAMIGLGSQRLEEELAKKFPDARISRIDSDSMASKNYYRLLQDFGEGRIDVLAGTQMLAKGLHFPNVTLVGIISADNAGANGSEAALIGALDKAGLTYVSIKGGDNETDAGFQGLIREANSDNPEVLVSLYSDAGCIGAMRGRVSLGIDTPMISTAICGSAEVLDVVGDDAIGWSFIGVGAPEDTPAAREFEAIIEPVYGSNASGSLGLGALGITQLMTLARVANSIADGGGEVTGPAIYDVLETTTELESFPNDSPLACGDSTTYPSICSFVFPIGEYVAGGEIRTIPGFEAKSVVDYLP